MPALTTKAAWSYEDESYPGVKLQARPLTHYEFAECLDMEGRMQSAVKAASFALSGWEIANDDGSPVPYHMDRPSANVERLPWSLVLSFGSEVYKRAMLSGDDKGN